jgi:hypothetical protein
MKDYSVTITLTVPITARNEEQAQERADQMQEWVKFDPPKNKAWAHGDIDFSSSVEEA